MFPRDPGVRRWALTSREGRAEGSEGTPGTCQPRSVAEGQPLTRDRCREEVGAAGGPAASASPAITWDTPRVHLWQFIGLREMSLQGNSVRTAYKRQSHT